MRSSFYLCIVGCITLLCCSCNRNKTVQKVCVESLYCIEIPGDLSTNEHLEGIASLQYWNRWKEFYVFVIDETKTQTTETTPNDSTETEPYNLQTQSELLTQK